MSVVAALVALVAVHAGIQPGGCTNPGSSANNFLSRFRAPEIDQSLPHDVTAITGHSAYLTCNVRNLGNQTVSWIRHRDLHILTVGGYTYTSDQRFQATHAPQTDDWTLHIKWTQARDAGVYECQVSTQPVRSFFVTLHVVECDEVYQKMFSDEVPSALILGEPELRVVAGADINLTCIIRDTEAEVEWFHNDQVISHASPRDGVSVVTEKASWSSSRLLVQRAAPQDSGRYACAPSNAEVASVRVHVLDGEHIAAYQSGTSRVSVSRGCLTAVVSVLELLLSLGRYRILR